MIFDAFSAPVQPNSCHTNGLSAHLWQGGTLSSVEPSQTHQSLTLGESTSDTGLENASVVSGSLSSLGGSGHLEERTQPEMRTNLPLL